MAIAGQPVLSIRSRRIGPAATFAAQGDSIETRVDVQAVLRRLLLFETCVLTTNRLLEIPQLVATFGSLGLITLLESGALKVTCEALSVADISQGVPALGLDAVSAGSYRLDVVRSADDAEYLHNSLQVVHTIAGIAHKDAKRLKLAIVENTERSPPTAGQDALAGVTGDLNNVALLRHLGARATRLVCGVEVDPKDLTISVVPVGHNTFRIRSNLSQRGIGEASVNKIHQKTILALADLNYRIEEMRNFSAVSGVMEDDALDLLSKLSFLLPERTGDQPERNLGRVITVAELPEIHPGERKFVDAERLLDVRNTPECRALRDWLRGSGNLSDAEIRDVVRGLQARIGGAFQSTRGKVMRFIASAALGVVSPAAGLAGGAIEQFVLDRMIKEPGAVAFLNRLYPSIFSTTL